jgi:hypothetical protein
MTRRPDWHPSYGTPIPSTLAERTAAMRDRMGIPHPRRLHHWGIAFGFVCMFAGLPLSDNYFPLALTVQAFGAAFVIPNVKALERRGK